MFDVRYHVLTLVAVFLALVIGLLLGVAIGDRGLVSGAERELRADLREDVEAARAEAAETSAELRRRQRYEQQTYPLVVGDRLAGRRVAVLTIGAADTETFEHVRDAVTPAGADVAFVGRLRLPLDLERLAEVAPGTDAAALGRSPDALVGLGERLGEQVVGGAALNQGERRALFAASSGALDGAEAVVLIRRRESEDEPDAAAAEREDAFLQALLDGLRSFDTPIAGAERLETEPSQVDWYRERGVSSIDNVDQVAGRAALVLVLAGGGTGAYGVRPGAQALLPETLVPDP